MAEIQLHVRGTSPLLTHNPTAMLTSAKPRAGKHIPSPEEEAEAGLYRLPDGSCGLPTIGFRNGIIEAAGAWKRGRGYWRSALTHIQSEPEIAQLLNAEGEPYETYDDIDRRRVVIQRQGIVRSRPRFEIGWSCRFLLKYEEDLVPESDIIATITADAGKRFGVGDYRPARKGWFGQYEVADTIVV